MKDDDICPTCGEEIDIDINPFEWGPGRYRASCKCQREFDAVVNAEEGASYKDGGFSSTLGDQLVAKQKENEGK